MNAEFGDLAHPASKGPSQAALQVMLKTTHTVS